MLEYLHIKNVALIDEQLINFSDGLNIITGETGAGKSMVIDSINFVLGEKVSKDFIRNGEKNALVEVFFFLKEQKTLDGIKSLGIEVDSNSILITREINKNGRTISKINGRIVTMNIIKEVSTILIDIHGQHEHQSLLNAAKHITLLDQFCSESLQQIKLTLKSEYKEYKEIQSQIKQLSGDEKELKRKIDILQYQINEIESANLKIGEEEDLLQQKKLLSSSEKIANGVNESNQLLNGDDENMGAIDQISRVRTILKELSNIDPKLIELSNLTENIEVQLEEVSIDLRNYNKNIEHNPELLYEVENRLALIYNLKKKYGTDIEEILSYYDDIKKQLDFILNSEEELNRLSNKLEIKQKEIIKLCEKLSELRKAKALEIQKQIENSLTELEMKNAKFQIQIEQKQEFNDNGFDKVEFLISPNIGEQLKSLSKIASGGEMSRVMLALKTILADVDNIETLIFDEIDTGVSGRTAQKVAEKMKYISKSHQILCITHLPQIAVMADNHYLIEKIEENNKTITKVHDLTQEQSIFEIARLIGGATITNSTLVAAKEMKELAKQ